MAQFLSMSPDLREDDGEGQGEAADAREEARGAEEGKRPRVDPLQRADPVVNAPRVGQGKAESAPNPWPAA